MTSPRTLSLSFRRALGWVLALALAAAILPAGTASAGIGPTSGPVGPDISGWQHPAGSTLDWDRAHAAGASFAFVKATEGTTFFNQYFANDFGGLAERHMVRGAYHYARPGLPVTSNADGQAAAYLATAGTLGAPGDLPPVLDFEESGGLTPPQLLAWATEWLTKVQAATGRMPILYTYPYFWQSAMANTTALSQYPLWLARYQTSTPAMVGGWSKYTFWQYTAGYKMDGVPAAIGLDMSTFNGTFAQLQALARTSGPGYVAPPVLGHIDTAVSAGDGTATTSGWAVDVDASDYTSVQLTVNQGAPVTTLADQYRPDVQAAYPWYSDHHGFSATVPAVVGDVVCATGLNQNSGSDGKLGCMSVTEQPPPAPIGSPSPSPSASPSSSPSGTPSASPTPSPSASPTPSPSVVPPPPAYAVASVRDIDHACPSDATFPSRFADVGPTTAHAREIRCIAWWGVTSGVTPTEFDPQNVVSRGQMARFLVQLVAQSGGTLPASTQQKFSDDATSPFGDDIEKLAAAGLVQGTGDGGFHPERPVTRGQMASFLARLYAYRSDAAPAVTSDYFTDDTGDVHEADINQVAALGVTGGVTVHSFEPALATNRGQMAGFLARLLDVLVTNGVTTRHG